MMLRSFGGLALVTALVLVPFAASAQKPGAGARGKAGERPADSSGGPRATSCAHGCWRSVLTVGTNKTVTMGSRAYESATATAFSLDLYKDQAVVIGLSLNTPGVPPAGRYEVQPNCPGVTHRQLPGAFNFQYNQPGGGSAYVNRGVVDLDSTSTTRTRGRFDIALCYTNGTTARLSGRFVALAPR